MIVGVFTSTMVEKKATHLKAFAESVKASGDECFIHNEPTYRECDIAVMLGTTAWKKDHTFNAAKEEIYKHHKGRTIHIDGQVFRSFTDRKYYRVSLDSVYFTQADFVADNCPADRWNHISRTFIPLPRPWRKDGDHILLCLQRNEGWSMKGTDPIQWGFDAIKTLRKHTDRKIVVRLHPTNNLTKDDFKNYENVTVSNQEKSYTLLEDLHNCWAMVTYNSSAALEPIVYGVPVFLGDPDCLAKPISNMDLADIENPQMLNRQQWFNNIGYSIWSIPEMKSGEVWKRFRDVL